MMSPTISLVCLIGCVARHSRGISSHGSDLESARDEAESPDSFPMRHFSRRELGESDLRASSAAALQSRTVAASLADSAYAFGSFQQDGLMKLERAEALVAVDERKANRRVVTVDARGSAEGAHAKATLAEASRRLSPSACSSMNVVKNYMPRFTADSKVKMFRVEQMMGNTWSQHMFYSFLDAYHGGISFHVDEGDNSTSKFLLSAASKSGGMAETLPDIISDSYGVVFRNNNEWLRHEGCYDPKVLNDTEVLVATMNGAQLNELISMATDYSTQDMVAQLFSVWPPNAKDTQRHGNLETTCDRFTEDAIWKAFEVGASIEVDRPALRRDFFAIITDTDKATAPRANGSDPAVVSFFQNYKNVIEGNPFHMLSSLFSLHASKDFYVYDQNAKNFLKVMFKDWYAGYAPMPMPEKWYSICNRDADGTTCPTGQCAYRKHVDSDERYCL